MNVSGCDGRGGGVLDLSVILPVFNEGKNIRKNLAMLDETLKQFPGRFEIIVVSDGSNDNTFEELNKDNPSYVKVHHYPKNQGKGYALKYGFSRCQGEYVVFIDADMDLHPKSISDFLHLLKQNNFDIVVGSKRHPGSMVNYPPIRRFYSASYQFLNKILFNLDVRDTQVGLKLFKREVLEQVCPRIMVKRYAFDLEVLTVAHHLGFDRIHEAPIELDYKFESSIDPKDVWYMLIDTLAIFYRLRIKRHYDRQTQDSLQSRKIPV